MVEESKERSSSGIKNTGPEAEPEETNRVIQESTNTTTNAGNSTRRDTENLTNIY